MSESADALALVASGDFRALTQAISRVEDGDLEFVEAIREFQTSAQPLVVGFTGSPGVGKSTLVSAAVTQFRKSFNSVAVIAVDPVSPFSGGALLGDRIRMQEHIADEKVFIRSMSTRGELGGVVADATDIIKLCAIAGFEVVIIETVGVGQSEIAVMHVAPTVVVVLAPGMGDGVQAAKAGVLEIADIVVVNKSDMPAAETTKRDVISAHLHSARYPEWTIPVVSTIAMTSSGVDQLCDVIEQHSRFLTH